MGEANALAAARAAGAGRDTGVLPAGAAARHQEVFGLEAGGLVTGKSARFSLKMTAPALGLRPDIVLAIRPALCYRRFPAEQPRIRQELILHAPEEDVE